MRRREFIATFGGAAAASLLRPHVAYPQTSAKHPMVAMLAVATPAAFEGYRKAFLQGMHELGRTEGGDFSFVERYADGFLERLPALADELVDLKPDVILAQTSSAAQSMARATTTIPIVVAVMADRLGLIGSDARPIGNVTGILVNLEGLGGKQLQIAVDAMPGAKKVGLLFNTANPGIAFQRAEFEAAAAALSVKLVVAEVRSPDDLETAFQLLTAERVGIVMVCQDSTLSSQRSRIVSLASAAGLPVMAAFREFAEAGALITYGINVRDSYRRAAAYVDKILKGAKPHDLPVELPTKLEMIINLKAAKALGLSVPGTMLTQADQVIE
jgi:putative tryptophan/tyrosine transport system substrate-binding protein